MNPAYDEQEGLYFMQINQLYPFDKASKVKARFAGIVLKVIRDEKITSFIVSDGTATAEVTLIYRKLSPALELPAKGDSVQLIGVGYKKVLGGMKNPFSFLKIFASCISRITPEQELMMCIEAASNRWKRSKEHEKVEKVQKLEPINQLRTFESTQEKIDLRTLVLTYCYFVFTKNPDINSYIFNPQMIRSSQDGHQFLNDARVTKGCLQSAIKKILQEMVTFQFITIKEMSQQNGSKQTFYVMKKQKFKGIERVFLQKIEAMRESGGVGIQKLTSHVNSHLCEYHKANFILFNWKFSQKILIKLQNQNKIYKTSDKLIFPNT